MLNKINSGDFTTSEQVMLNQVKLSLIRPDPSLNQVNLSQDEQIQCSLNRFTSKQFGLSQVNWT